MITGAAIPSGQARIRTELHHTKWRSSARKGMSMTACSYKRIYEFDDGPLHFFINGPFTPHQHHGKSNDANKVICQVPIHEQTSRMRTKGNAKVLYRNKEEVRYI